MPRIWVINPEKWQKLGKINLKNSEFSKRFLARHPVIAKNLI